MAILDLEVAESQLQVCKAYADTLYLRAIVLQRENEKITESLQKIKKREKASSHLLLATSTAAAVLLILLIL